VTSGFVKGDATANNVAVLLPVAAATYNPIEVCKSDSTSHTVTITANATHPDLIDGAATFVLRSQNHCLMLVDSAANTWSIRGTFLVEPVRLATPFQSNVVPTANVAYQLALSDTIDFPANFSSAGMDPSSNGLCTTNPTTYPDAFDFRCGTSGSITSFGSVVFNTTGTPSFSTGTRPYLRSSTLSTPGSNGGTVTMPSSIPNGDLLIMEISAGNNTTCPATITGWTAQGSHGNTANNYLCYFTRIANNEPASYTVTLTQGYPSFVIKDYANAANSTSPDVAIAYLSSTSNVTAISAPALSSLTSSQDMLDVACEMGGGNGLLFTSTGSILPAQFAAWTNGVNYGILGGLEPLTTANPTQRNMTYSGATDFVCGSFAVAPATNGGIATCGANNLVQVVAPTTPSGVCPITLAGHTP